jgi:hypothetical protein
MIRNPERCAEESWPYGFEPGWKTGIGHIGSGQTVDPTATEKVMLYDLENPDAAALQLPSPLGRKGFGTSLFSLKTFGRTAALNWSSASQCSYLSF